MMKHIVPAIMLTIVMTVITGLAYPLAMTGLAGLLFPYQANGSLIEHNGQTIGSELIGQNFTSDNYFHGRPSATTDTDPNDPTKTVPAPYNAANSGGSNLGPTSKSLVDRVKGDADQLAATNPSAKIPVDLITTSASGLDPDITPAAALFQVPRVAKVRGVSEDQLRGLVAKNTSGRILGILGEPHVNVLKLNVALDESFPMQENPSAESGRQGSSENNENLSAAEATPAPTSVPPTSEAAEAPPATAPQAQEALPERKPSAPPIAAAPPAVAPPQGNPSEGYGHGGAATAASAAVFPKEISPAHASEKPEIALLKTCSDQYRANAATNSNGSLKRNAYIKECKKRLKG